jgi:hypothetical protein
MFRAVYAALAAIGKRLLLARSRSIKLAGTEIETPLLVPAISSKALGPIELGEPGNKNPPLKPASMVHTDGLIRSISEAVLISAYDIHHEYVHNASAFQKGFQSSAYAAVKVMFIDSGWYEKSVGVATGLWYHEVGDKPLPFEREQHVELIDSLDKHVSAVVVSWDSPDTTYTEQINAAQEFFGVRRRFSSDILLKPPRTRRYHSFDELSGADAARLKAFDVVGVTEKELGESPLSRLTSLGQLRTLMDGAKVEAPIHVFGGLDPLLTPLYVAVGAEIFDGLSWLRYAFRDGLSISSDNAVLLEHVYSRRFLASVSHLQLANLTALDQLTQELKVFVDKACDWSKLRRGDDLRPVFEAFEAALRSGGHGR